MYKRQYSVCVVGANAYGGNGNYNKYNQLYSSDTAKRDFSNIDIHITGSNTQLRFLPLANKAYTVRVAELKIDKPDAVSSDATLNF